MPKQRVIRVLVYEGTPEWIQETMKRNAVKGSHVLPNGNCIKEAIIGDFLEEVIERKVEVPDA